MPANFLHGVETIEVTVGALTVRGVKSAAIGLVGTAPTYAVDVANQTLDRPQLILSVQDARKYFGPATPGFTIPAALDAIFDQGRGIIVVVNTFDPATNNTVVGLANHVLDANDTIDLGHKGINTVVVKDSTGVTTYVLNTDYTIDAINGKVLRKGSGAILALATLKISYHYADPSLVVAADIVGTVDGSGNRTGLKALDDTYGLFGFNPKLLIAPVYCTQETVAAELEVRANALRAIALIDAPIGTTVADAITGRGSSGTINFETSSDRVIPCYPHCLVDDGNGGTALEPYSQRLAGMIAARDVLLGYHYSPSNAPIEGIVGVERALTARLNDPNSEVNALNEVGITTIFNAFGTGFRSWGNRSAAYPASTAIETFVSVRRTADIIEESIEAACLAFMDKPINDALVDAIKESVNAFIRDRIGAGAVVDGSCTFDPARNPPDQIAAGHLLFSYDFVPPPPSERLTFESFVNVSLLSSIGAQN